jgi:small subunit ribosomal protein S14
MKLKNKLLKDICLRVRFKNIESRKRSLKVLIRLKLVNYLSILNNLSKLNKDSNFGREKNRCFITSRPSGNFSKISLSRIKIRELASSGLILGFSKASW